MQPLGADEPTTVGPYRLLGRLGSGGMGRVYLGRSAGGRTVAVKIVHPHFALDEEFRARFRREAEAARRVGGAWTAPVLDADPEAPVPWIATAYAAGPSLTAAVTDGGALPAHTVRALGAGLAEALAAVHELGLVHRDVKPSNVLLTLDGPLLIDFGIARATDGTASLTSTGVSIGSPGYMSPEQILGKGVTGAADVFSLGAVLGYAATGAPPFPGDSSAALLYKVVHEEPELDGLDGELRELAAACLAKDPGARPAPRDIAARLAPEGTARLISGGWLPGPLVERVSRSAVQLLNLETAGGGGEASGPVGFSSPAVNATPTPSWTPTPPSAPTPVPPSTPAPSPTPATSPPLPSLPPTPTPTPPPSVPGPGSHGGSGGSGGGFGPAPVMPSPHAPTFVPPPTDERPGRVSVSLSATTMPGDGGRGRRLSCTVALAVAGALAAVTVGSAFLFDLVPGGGEHDSADQGPGTGTRTPSASQSAPGDSSGGAAAVPDRYLGTWEGQGTALGGALPMGAFRVTVEQAKVGEEVGRVQNTDPLGGVCTDVLTLKEVSGGRLLADSVGAEGNHAGCSQAAHTVSLTPVGDDLRYKSDSSDSGRPEARLSKVE
ncbi:serine/threonine-protein kinase [Streptomyces sp. B93]|uniref:serine/threonine-protein kinase n=1 Tax=Streptomyces sp. B93 TaxID=2824875 RepID=UPI001B35A40C|nr:serine/threonine-protein kinase [Streptomyces sp. B93]MBQ1093547.1 serine/threonine protein kinase [Streptomyces sp. B93]